MPQFAEYVAVSICIFGNKPAIDPLMVEYDVNASIVADFIISPLDPVKE